MSNSIHKDPGGLQLKQKPVRIYAQAIFLLSGTRFLNIAGAIILQTIETMADVLSDWFWQGAQLVSSFFAD